MKRYSFADLVVIVNGVEIGGFAEGDDVIQARRLNESITHTIGAGGEMMAAVSADRTGEIILRLQQTSSSNQYLGQLIDLQQAAGSKFVPVTVMFQDTYRQDMGSGSVGYIAKPADIVRGAGGNVAEWRIVVERLDLIYGNVPTDILGIFGAQ